MALPEDFPDFRFVHVTRPGPGVLMVRWAILPTGYPLDDIHFEIFRSNGPEGPWDLLGVAEQGRHTFTDFKAQGDPISRTFYYIVRAASAKGIGCHDSAPVVLQHDPDHIALEMVRKKNLFLAVRGGIGSVVLLKKTWGAKCARCWNFERMLAEDADCPVCFGTGFSGGFMNPVEIPVLFNPPKKVIVDAGLKYEPYNVYVEMSNYPVLGTKDIVVDQRQNIRYEIDQISPTAHRMFTISQVCMLLRLDENSVVYRVPVSEPLKSPYGQSWDLLK